MAKNGAGKKWGQSKFRKAGAFKLMGWWSGTDCIRRERMRTAQLALSAAKGEPYGWGESSNRALCGSIPDATYTRSAQLIELRRNINGGRDSAELLPANDLAA